MSAPGLLSTRRIPERQLAEHNARPHRYFENGFTITDGNAGQGSQERSVAQVHAS